MSHAKRSVVPLPAPRRLQSARPAFAVLVALLCLFPFFFLLGLSFVEEWRFPDILPDALSLDNWRRILAGPSALGASFLALGGDLHDRGLALDDCGLCDGQVYRVQPLPKGTAVFGVRAVYHVAGHSGDVPDVSVPQGAPFGQCGGRGAGADDLCVRLRHRVLFGFLEQGDQGARRPRLHPRRGALGCVPARAPARLEGNAADLLLSRRF